ncbi:hypothetical protein D3C87_1792450 [compost metagenome]
MHRQEMTDTVTGAMIVVEPKVPKRPARKGVEVMAVSPFRKFERGHGNRPLEDCCIGAADLIVDRPDCRRARRIRRAGKILATGIEQIDAT